MSVYDVHLCFLEKFLDSDTFVLVDVYDDPGRQNEIEKLKISDQQNYLSFLSDNGKILGKFVSTLDKTVYTELSHKVVKTKEMRRIKRAPKIKTDQTWKVSASKILVMGKRMEIAT